MGASIVLRHAGLIGGVDAVVSVSGPGRWYYRGTKRMRQVHCAVEHRLGRLVTRRLLKTRISPEGWKLVPVPPAEAAALISSVPLLIVHGDQDPYFPPEHARQLYMAAREPKELWLLPGMGHAESACSDDLVDRIARWLDQAAAQPVTPAAPDEITHPAPGEPEPAPDEIPTHPRSTKRLPTQPQRRRRRRLATSPPPRVSLPTSAPPASKRSLWVWHRIEKSMYGATPMGLKTGPSRAPSDSRPFHRVW